jgi:hypothetical protein
LVSVEEYEVNSRPDWKFLILIFNSPRPLFPGDPVGAICSASRWIVREGSFAKNPSVLRVSLSCGVLFDEGRGSRGGSKLTHCITAEL